MDARAMIDAVNGVTKKWAKQRKAEERQQSRALRREEVLTRTVRYTIKDAAYEVMEDAYRKASSNGTLPAHARQIMYAARGSIQEWTGRTLDDQYFTQTLLPNYMAENADTTDEWDVVFDARGHFAEPHTKRIVPLGTLDVRAYLARIESQQENGAEPELRLASVARTSTTGPQDRFGAILFVEKEGFMPLFTKVKLAERFDIAIMSTKGMSVTASRLLVDRLCASHDIPLLVLHDFDKSGFSIISTLQRDTRRYAFESEFRVIDLGLRLPDVEKWGLESEDVAYGKSDPEDNLRANGATEEEIAFLLDRERSRWRHHVGRRVELNAFTSADLIRFIEAGLVKHGVKKLIPDADTLETAYRRATARQIVERELKDIVDRAKADAEAVKVPKSLKRQIQERLATNPELPWDAAMADVVAGTS